MKIGSIVGFSPTFAKSDQIYMVTALLRSDEDCVFEVVPLNGKHFGKKTLALSNLLVEICTPEKAESALSGLFAQMV